MSESVRCKACGRANAWRLIDGLCQYTRRREPGCADRFLSWLTIGQIEQAVDIKAEQVLLDQWLEAGAP